MTLVETNSQVISASKTQSLTTNMQIKVDSPFVSFVAADEAILGRLRGNNSSNAFYIFDFGVNPKDVKPG